MTDICDCGLCDVPECDHCTRASEYLDPEGGSWCRRCRDRYEDAQNELLSEREYRSFHQGGAFSESLSEQAWRLWRMKGEGRHE